MKIIDERKTQKQNETKQKKQRQERKRVTKAIVKGWELNDFLVHLRFSQINM